ncbi:MAG: FtsX-like permease family protein, partial [Planctomycetota bacterium]
EVLTSDQLKRRESAFWSSQTPVGIIFSIGVVMGFAVGVIICYQILFTSLQDAMSEFATLKAMGYPNRFFISLVVRQSLYLSLFGFIPAVVISYGLFGYLEWLSGLPMRLTLGRMASVLGLTSAMCLVSGLLAMRKLLHADPASLF